MSPLVCFSSPAIIRSKVVLPQPLGPRRTRNSPSRVLKSTPSTAVWSWKTFRICFVSTVAMEESQKHGAWAACGGRRYSSFRSFHFCQILRAFASASLTASSGDIAPVAACANIVFSTQVE